jgi:hypothetical protein
MKDYNVSVSILESASISRAGVLFFFLALLKSKKEGREEGRAKGESIW